MAAPRNDDGGGGGGGGHQRALTSADMPVRGTVLELLGRPLPALATGLKPFSTPQTEAKPPGKTAATPSPGSPVAPGTDEALTPPLPPPDAVRLRDKAHLAAAGGGRPRLKSVAGLAAMFEAAAPALQWQPQPQRQGGGGGGGGGGGRRGDASRNGDDEEEEERGATVVRQRPRSMFASLDLPPAVAATTPTADELVAVSVRARGDAPTLPTGPSASTAGNGAAGTADEEEEEGGGGGLAGEAWASSGPRSALQRHGEGDARPRRHLAGRAARAQVAPLGGGWGEGNEGNEGNEGREEGREGGEGGGVDALRRSRPAHRDAHRVAAGRPGGQERPAGDADEEAL
ncbi:uncharacterized protein LOC144737515 [Lampetra planeri]